MATIRERLRRMRWSDFERGWRHLLVVSVAYLLLTFVATWPLVRGLGRDVPADLADPLLNCWILAWGSEHVFRFVGGDWGAFQGWWNANIFYPHTLTLAYSEHMIAPAIQAAPIYALTGNLILTYNCLFLSAFVLSGVGAYFLALDLTGDRRAAFVAGLLFAFAPYRFDQISHLQVMSSQWMPFALLGFRRYVVTRRLLFLVGGLAAVLCQGLTCGYYLLYFPPFVALFTVWEMARNGRLRDVRMWLALTVAATIFLQISMPFLMPYAELRKLEPTVRDMGTVRANSADVFSYVSSNRYSPLWGRVLTAIRRGEAQLFPGLSTYLLALAAVAIAFWRRLAGTKPEVGIARRRRIAIRIAFGAVVFFGVALILDLMGVRARVPLGVLTVTVSSIGRTAISMAIVAGVLFLLSRRAREVFQGWSRSTTLFLIVFAALAVYLSLGPVPCALSKPLSMPSLFGLLRDNVPGFDGLRVPARYAMIAALALALLGGVGAAALARVGKAGRWLAVLAAVFFMVEAPWYPLRINGTWGTTKVKPPQVPKIGEQLPAVYRYVQSLPKDAVLLEMPIGYTCYETRYLFYSTFHWRRLVNGYSGYFPEQFMETATALKRIVGEPGEAIVALRRSGATHVILHREAWIGLRAGRVERRLKQAGLKIVADFDTAAVLAVPGQEPATR